MPDPAVFSDGKRGRHLLLVDFVRTNTGDPDLLQRDPDRLGLQVEERLTHSMHADSMVIVRHRRQQGDDLKIGSPQDGI